MASFISPAMLSLASQTRALLSSSLVIMPSNPAVSPKTRITSPVTSVRPLAPTEAAIGGRSQGILASIWREIQGCEDWEDLVQPLNPILREEIIRYGEFVAACYKAFDLDPASKRYLNCKYAKRSMLEDVGLGSSGYNVTRYIYATPPETSFPLSSTCCSRWIGYVAVASDEEAKRIGRRDILVSFRGTVTQAEWVANFMSSLTPAGLDPHDPRQEIKVESGFLSLYTSEDTTSSKFSRGSCRQQLLSELSKLLNRYKGEDLSITVAGHSMGSSLALLLAYDIAELGINSKNSTNAHIDGDADDRIPITVYSFAGPRVGNTAFKQRCEELGVKVLRIVNVNDPITKMPGVFLNDSFRSLAAKYGLRRWSWCSCYTHVGVELALDFFQMENPIGVHDLETYIGLLKCPEMVEQMKKDGVDVIGMVREILVDLILHKFTRSVSSLCWLVHVINLLHKFYKDLRTDTVS